MLALREEINKVNGGFNLSDLIKGDLPSPKFEEGEEVWIKSLNRYGTILDYVLVREKEYYYEASTTLGDVYWISENDISKI